MKIDEHNKRVRRIMKKGLFFILIFYSFIFLSGCTQERAEKKEVIARINDYKLTLQEFEDQLIEELTMETDFKVTREAKSVFLEQLIRKELLIQEAQKQRMDRKKKFIKTIERYWESTLIRDLMELKGDEFDKRTYISEEEIDARYQEMKKTEGELPPIEEIREQIAEQLKDQKKREKLKQWINNLRKNAKIEIDQKLLHQGG